MLTDVTTDTIITKEETFGPGRPSTASSGQEALKKANDTELGLASLDGLVRIYYIYPAYY